MPEPTTPTSWTPTGVLSYGQEWEHITQHPHRPIPDPATGELLVDPEVRLNALGFGIDVSFYYSSKSDLDGPAGRARNANIFQSMTCTFVGSRPEGIVKVTGGMQRYAFEAASTSGSTTTYAPTTSMVSTTLTYNSADRELTEYYADGMKAVYGTLVSGPSEMRIKRVVDTAGHQHTYSYTVISGTPYLTSIEVPGGSRVSMAYVTSTGTSLLSGIEDWGNRKWTFSYDANRQLVSMAMPSGCVTRYGYTSTTNVPPGSILYSIEDPRGFVSTYTYSDAGRVTSMCLGDAVWNYVYDDPNSRTVVTNPAGGLTTYTFDVGKTTKVETPDGVIESLTYDNQGWVSRSIKQLGVSMSWEYNRVGLVEKVTDAAGNTSVYKYDTELNLVTIIDQFSREWNLVYFDDVSLPLSMRRLKETIDPLGNRTQYTWDAATKLVKTVQDPRGLVTTYNYDPLGNVASMVYPDGGVVTNQFDLLNRLVQTIDPLGRKTDFQYDDADHVTARIGPYIVEADAPRWSYVYESCLMTVEVDPLGNRTTYSYGRYGNRTKVVTPDGKATTYQYDNMGYLTTTIDAMGFTMVYEYDVAKRLTTQTDQLGYKTTYKFDAVSRQTTVTDANSHSTYTQFDSRSNPTTVTDALGNVTTMEYDAASRQVRMTDPSGNSRQTVYDEIGRATATVDPLGNRTTYSFDASGNVTTVVDANLKVTTNTYTLTSNRVVSVTDANGNTTGYSYDFTGQQTEIIDPAGGRITMVYTPEGWRQAIANQLNKRTTTTYDRKGRPVTVINPRLRVKTLAYDVMDRVVSIGYASGDSVVFGYDDLGRRTTMVDSGGTTTYVYSKRGELVDQTVPGPLRLQMAYDPVGNRTTLIDPDGGIFAYSYDQLNRLSQVVNPSARTITQQYDAASRLISLSTDQGWLRRWEYDAASRLTTLTERDPSSTVIMTIVDTWDGAGNKIETNKDGVRTTYTLDDGYRLLGQVTANSSANATFAYDSRGNMTVKNNQPGNPLTMSYDAANRLVTVLSGALTATYTFDDNGNLIQEQTNLTSQWSYDDEDRMIVEVSGGVINGRVTNTYSGDGLRRSMKRGSTLTTYVWDGIDYLQERS